MKKAAIHSPGRLVSVLFVSLSFLLVNFYCEAKEINSSVNYSSERSAPIISTTHDIDFFEVWVGSTNYPDFIYIRNEGSEPLVISRISSSSSDFHIDTLPAEGIVIEPDGFFEVAISFHPTSLGEITGEISIESNDPINPVVSASVKGVGVPSPLNRTSFQHTLLTNQQASQAFVITNNTDEFVEYRVYTVGHFLTSNLNGIAIPLNPGEFKLVPFQSNSVGLTEGSYSGNINVQSYVDNHLMFQWMDVQLDVIDSGPIISSSHSESFGPLWIGGWNFPICPNIKNNGNEPLVIYSVTSTHPDFHITQTPPEEGVIILPSGDELHNYYTPCISFVPSSLGNISGEIIITSNDPINPIVKLLVDGVGTPSPIQQTSLTDTLFAHQKSKKYVTITNTTTEPAHYSWVALNNGNFIDDPFKNILLQPGESNEIEVLFNSHDLLSAWYEGEIWVNGANGNNYYKIPITLYVANTIQNFSLIYHKSGAVASHFDDMITLDVADPNIEKYTIRANTIPGEVSSVKFMLDGNFINIDNTRPYTINAWTLPVLSEGLHTLSAQAFSKNNARGHGFEIRETHINVINSAAITQFNIVDGNGNIIKPLFNGDVINIGLAEFHNINIVASTSIATTKSVKFTLNGITARIDNRAPYGIYGASNGYETPWPIRPGTFTLTAVPYMHYYGWGPGGVPLTVHFTIINNTPSMANARVASENTPVQEEESLIKNAEIRNHTIVYPNPVDNELHVVLNGIEDGDFALKIMSTNGQVLYNFKGDAMYTAEHIIHLNQLGLTSGVYYLEITDNNGYHEVKKLMKR